jgi:hypothetical protein
VKKGDILYTVYSGSVQKLDSAVLLAENLNPMGITGEFGEKMLVDRIPTKKISYEKPFILER